MSLRSVYGNLLFYVNICYNSDEETSRYQSAIYPFASFKVFLCLYYLSPVMVNVQRYARDFAEV